MENAKTKFWRGAALTSGAACALVVASCGGGAQTPLDPAGPHAGGISRLWWVFFYVLTSVFVLVMIALALSVRRGRSRRDLLAGGVETAPPAVKPEEGQERRMTNVVAAATAATILILFILLVASFLTGRGLTTTRSDAGALTIEVTGHQWWWEVRYDDPQPSNIFTTANEIHIPVGTPVIIQLKSTDVIHSFWVPNLAGKKDAIPGKSSSVWLRADRAGVYRGQCAEYCGAQHAHMAFTVIAEPPEKFWAWVASQRAPSVEPATDAERRGQQVFLSSPCIMCHTVRGTQAGGAFGPNLTHVASRGSIAANTLPNSRGHLAGWVVDAQSVKPGSLMPPMSLSSEDLQALLDYLQSLK
ncbi:MAG: cytochrome c oxidase subunit [Acidobacteriota bacterium]|jgi:cytochrome c oxidase subunit 2|nr:cytochrome c oxidase subunit [Acidobacteriota bacterium]